MVRVRGLAPALVLVLSACVPTADSFAIHRFSVSAQNELPPLDRTVAWTG